MVPIKPFMLSSRRYAERHYAERRYAECRDVKWRYAERRYAERRYAECRDVKWRSKLFIVFLPFSKNLDIEIRLAKML